MRRGGDWAWCLREALGAHTGPVLLVTITAPGSDVLPLNVDGTCDRLALAEWTSTMVVRWRQLSNKSRMRAYGSASGTAVLAYVWQLQRRGAPHLHIAVSAGPRGRIYAGALKTLAQDFGFGFVDIRRGGESALAVGSYLSRYLSRDLGSTGPYTEFLPPRVAYVNRDLARRAGVGIRVARKLRHLWVFANRDPSCGVPKFDSEWLEAWTYYWYRVGRRGRENVRKPLLAG